MQPEVQPSWLLCLQMKRASLLIYYLLCLQLELESGILLLILLTVMRCNPSWLLCSRWAGTTILVVLFTVRRCNYPGYCVYSYIGKCKLSCYCVYSWENATFLLFCLQLGKCWLPRKSLMRCEKQNPLTFWSLGGLRFLPRGPAQAATTVVEIVVAGRRRENIRFNLIGWAAESKIISLAGTLRRASFWPYLSRPF
jgi:hypothetical protein